MEVGLKRTLSGVTRNPLRTCWRHSNPIRLSTTVKEASETEREIRSTSFSIVDTASLFWALAKVTLAINNATADQRGTRFMKTSFRSLALNQHLEIPRRPGHADL